MPVRLRKPIRRLALAWESQPPAHYTYPEEPPPAGPGARGAGLLQVPLRALRRGDGTRHSADHGHDISVLVSCCRGPSRLSPQDGRWPRQKLTTVSVGRSDAETRFARDLKRPPREH